MHGEKALWVPLIRSEYDKDPRYMYIYATDVFTPLSCPVFGELDDYGRLTEIERTANVEALERVFGCKIEDFFNYDRFPIQIPGMPEGTHLSGTFIYEPAFRHVQKHQYDEGGDNVADLTQSYISEGILNICGFTFHSQDTTRERYNRLFTSEEFPNVKWWADDHDSGHFDSEKRPTVYRAIDFVKALEKQTHTSLPALVTQLKLGSRAIVTVSGCIDKILKAEAAYAEAKEKGGDDELRMWARMTTGEHWRDLIQNIAFGRYPNYKLLEMFKSLYGDNLREHTEDLANLMTLSSVMFTCNRFWSPQANGYQYGSMYQEQDMAKWIAKDRQRRMKERHG
jgi:hypothetical protein